MKNIILIPAVVSSNNEKKLRNTPLINKIYEYSINSWKHFAKKYDCQVVVLDEPLMDTNVTSLAWQRYLCVGLAGTKQY